MKKTYKYDKNLPIKLKLYGTFVILLIFITTLGWGQIVEDFEGTSAPTGWTFSPAGVWGTAQPCSGNRSISFTGTGQFAVTPAITNPGFLSFSKRRSNDNSAWSMKIQISTSPSGPWTDVETISTITDACQTSDYIDLSSFTGTRYIRFLDTRGTGTHQRAIDDVVITQASTPFDLSSGNYTFSGWSSDVAAGRYPANGATGADNTTGVATSVALSNMSFWVHSTTDPDLNTSFQDYWQCPYNLTSRSRFQGEGTNGISMVNTGNSQTCTSCTGAPCGVNDIQFGRAGAVVLNLNSTGRENIQVAWTGRTKEVNNRIYRLQLQYRIGETLDWVDIAGQMYERGNTAGHSENFNATLPSVCDDKELIQLRWVYYYVSGSNTRAQLTLDDITVSSSPVSSATITTGTVSGTPFSLANCASTASSTVNYTITGTFNSGNVFTAELSGANGNFTQPLAIGSVTSTTGGTINITIPENLLTGTGYRIRVVGSDPATVGAQSAAFTITQNGEYCPQVGDYRTTGSNTWATTGIWESYNYIASTKTRIWQAASSQPNNAPVSVYIRNGHTVTLSDGPKSINHLVIESGGRLWRNNTGCSALSYVNLGGDILCNGDIGNGTTSDAIGINIQAGSHAIKGSGNFNAWRIRLSDEDNNNAVRGDADLTIDMDVNLRWPGTVACSGSGGNAIYSNRSANSIFNVTINAGKTLRITESNASVGMDGANAAPTVYPGSNRGGGYTVYGTIDCAGQYMLGSNNPAAQRPYMTIKNGGLLKVRFLDYGDNNSASGGALTIENGGKLEITGAGGGDDTWVSNTVGSIIYDIQAGSTIEYMGNVAQNVPGNLFNYRNLIKSGTGTATLTSAATVTENFTISAGTFDVSTSDHALNVGGNWTNNATFTPRSGTVTFNGTGAQTIATGGTGAGKVFHNVTINKSGGTATLSAAMQVNNNFTLTAGTFDVSTDNHALNVGGNWTNNAAFTPRNGSVTFNGTGAQTIATGGTGAGKVFHNVTINKTGGNTLLSNHMQIDNVLTLTSNTELDLNSNDLILTNEATTALVRTAGYIKSESTAMDSRIIRNMNAAGVYLYPFGIGTSADDYIPFEFNKTNAGLAQIAAATYRPDLTTCLPHPPGVQNLNSLLGLSPDNRDATIKRFWQIDALSGSPVGNVTYTFANAEVTPSSIQVSRSRMQRYNSLTHQWELPLTGQTTGTRSITVPGVSTFSSWAAADQEISPLPVKWGTFNVEKMNENVLLGWTTVSEVNNSHFEVQHSINGIYFNEIGRVPGNGFSNQTLKYNYLHQSPALGLNYYRLKQVDFNGAFEYSEIRYLNFELSDAMLVKQFSDFIQIEFENNPNGDTQIRMIDFSGRMVSVQKVSKGEGTAFVVIDTQYLASGAYNIQLIRNGVYVSNVTIALRK